MFFIFGGFGFGALGTHEPCAKNAATEVNRLPHFPQMISIGYFVGAAGISRLDMYLTRSRFTPS